MFGIIVVQVLLLAGSAIADDSSYVVPTPIFQLLSPKGRRASIPHTSKRNCPLSRTTVKGKRACQGELIFEENFDTLDGSIWKKEIRIPLDTLDADFVSFQDKSENCYVSGGQLHIVPTLLTEVPEYDEIKIRRGELNFGSECTGIVDIANECQRQAHQFRILPPIVSARIRTKDYFSFRYGQVEVRARLTKGDWLFPQILLEPFSSEYGIGGYASGQMRVAFIRGNELLETRSGEQIGGTRLSGGVVLTSGETYRDTWLKSSSRDSHLGSTFHTYSLTWDEEAISLAIDGKNYATIREEFSKLSTTQNITYARFWESGNHIAPFDKEFYIALGVSAGGVSDFPDGCKTGADFHEKPWRNTDPKAEMKFWQDRNRWHGTWDGENAGMAIDYIKVWALTSDSSNRNCPLSRTTVRGRPACQGELIFEDNFDTLDESIWKKEIRIPLDTLDADFVSFQDRPENCYVNGGQLHIVPTLLTEVPEYDEIKIRRGELNFGSECTGIVDIANECRRQAQHFIILPPIVSARIRTKDYFSFRYGKVEVRARLTKGDWLFPQILLEPFSSAYSIGGYASGQMRVAFIRGNELLETRFGEQIGGTRLSGGVVLTTRETYRDVLLKSTHREAHLGNTFHIYSLTWDEEAISLAIDGNNYARIQGEFSRLFTTDNITYARFWEKGNFMAPFDKEFYIALGVSAGGISDFPDGCKTGADFHEKPWRNTDPKAELNFWKDRNKWHRTWDGENAGMAIDYIKVWAL